MAAVEGVDGVVVGGRTADRTDGGGFAVNIQLERAGRGGGALQLEVGAEAQAPVAAVSSSAMINRNRCFIILIIFCLYFVCYTIFCCRLGDAMTILETNGYKAPRHPSGCLGGYFSEGISGGIYGLLARNIAICLLNTSIICCSWGWLRFTMSAM